MKGQSFGRRLGFAAHGIRVAFGREQSFRAQILAGAVVSAVLLITRPPAIWWAVGALSIGLVLVAELLNTALETLCDHLHPERHPEIRVVKDIAAGGVLLSSAVGLVVAVAFLLR
jgi:diacylglycerol kinase (ATP)